MNEDMADEIVQKAALMAVLYYPEIHADDPEYRLSTQVDWCLEEAEGIDGDDREALRDLLARVIIDPTGHREAMCAFVFGLVPDETE